MVDIHELSFYGVPCDDPRKLFEEIRDHMIHTAWILQWQNQSYRNFGVGAAALAYDTREGIAKLIIGVNFKRNPQDRKYCAEADVADRLWARGFDTVTALVICGPPQPDEASGLVTPTLHPCAACRDMFLCFPAFRDDSLIVTTHVKLDVFRSKFNVTAEEHTVPELLARHGHHQLSTAVA